MKHRKWLLVILALVLLCGAVPMAASANQDREFLGTAVIERRVNPLYEGLISEEDFPEISITAPKLDTQQLYATTYVTVDKAAQQVRDAMGDREGTFTISVKDKSSDYNEVFDLLIMTAFEHTGVPTEGDYLQWHYETIGASLSYSADDNYYYYDFAIEMTYYTTAAQEKELDTAVANLLKTLNVSSKSDYQKICAVYDYICDNITYDNENLEDNSYTLKFSAYAALQNKTAVCQGYALLFYRLMLELDVDARLIAGDGGGPHAWNIVQLGDVYYNLDSTWDAGMTEYQFFLKNTENFVDHARYLEYMTTQFHTDYPVSATDYVDGVAGEPEYYFVIGQCGDNAYFAVDRDRNLTIAGEGATYSETEVDNMGIVIWDYWTDGFDTVIVEEGITTLGGNAFYDMDNIKSVTLPDSLTHFNDFAFYSCDGLTEIKFPANVQYVGRGAFDNCTSLKKLELNDGLQIIDMEGFRNCTALTSVRIPDSVIELSNHAFGECSKLQSVVLSKSITSIPGYVFSNCTSLKDIEFHEGLVQINPAAFDYCTSLTDITFPASITDVYGFSGCTGLKTITFQGEAPNIGYYAFSGVTATVYYPGNLAGWDEVINGEYDDANLTWVSVHTHSYTSSVVAPTCTEQGYTLYTCECGNSYKDTYVAALGHELGELVFENATKSHVGVCGVCGESVSESCEFDGGTVVDEATRDEFGTVRYTCTVCGGSYEERVIYRVSGAGRSETAIAAAEELKEVLGLEKFDTVVLASGEGFADALAGSYLAVKQDAPILLVRKSTVELNRDYILENLSEDGTVYILGGTAAVPQEMEDALDGLNVVRLQGANRFETNLLILEEAGIEDEEILICTGWQFADSLSASATGLPILMLNTTQNELTETQTAFLQKYAENEFTIIGGTAAVSEKLEADMEVIVGEADRVSGSTREDTSVQVAQRYFTAPGHAVVAYSRNFPDGLCGGPLAHALGAPLLLVNTNQESYAAEYIKTQGITHGFVLGGTAAVSNETAQRIFPE